MANMRVIAYPKLTHWLKASIVTTSWNLPSKGTALHRRQAKFTKLQTQLQENRFNLGGIRLEVRARARTSRQAIDIVTASGALDLSFLSRYRPSGDQLKFKYITIPDYLALIETLSQAAVRNGLWILRNTSALPRTRVSQLRDFMNAFLISSIVPYAEMMCGWPHTGQFKNIHKDPNTIYPSYRHQDGICGGAFLDVLFHVYRASLEWQDVPALHLLQTDYQPQLLGGPRDLT